MSSVEVDNGASNEGADKVVGDVQAQNNARVIVRKSDMPLAMQKEAIATIVEVLQKVPLEKDAATAIKQAFDSKSPKSTWHCIVGKHFAASITHQTNYQLFISVDNHTVILFKSQD